MRTKDRAAGNLPDEPTACIGHQDRERHDGGLEFAASRARERRRHADPLDRLNLVGIRSPFRGLTFLREKEMEGPLQIRGQIVPGVHLEELRCLESRLFHEFAPRARLRGLPVPGGPAGQRVDDPPEPVPILASEDDLLLRGDREDGGGGPEVHPDPALPCAARQFDLLLRDRWPSLPQRLGRQDAGFRRHGTRAAPRPGYLSPSMRRRSGLRSSEHNSYYEPPGFPRQMPLRFWKKDKPEKGKPEKETEEPKEKPKEPAAPKPTATEKTAKAEPAAKKPEEKPGAPAAPPKPGEVEVFVTEAHAGLVDLGLTVAPTKAVFAKRVAAYPGGDAAFVAEYRSAPYKAVTRVLADWLGFRVPETFELGAILKHVNPRLS